MDKDERNFYYQLGKRDACAQILMMVRDKGAVATLREVADQILAVDEKHPHALWVKENIK